MAGCKLSYALVLAFVFSHVGVLVNADGFWDRALGASFGEMGHK
jgi:hypothetical protein